MRNCTPSQFEEIIVYSCCRVQSLTKCFRIFNLSILNLLFNTNSRIVRNYDLFIRRNLARGYTRKELNVSFLRGQRLKLQNKVESMKKCIKDCCCPESKKKLE